MSGSEQVKLISIAYTQHVAHRLLHILFQLDRPVQLCLANEVVVPSTAAAVLLLRIRPHGWSLRCRNARVNNSCVVDRFKTHLATPRRANIPECQRARDDGGQRLIADQDHRMETIKMSIGFEKINERIDRRINPHFRDRNYSTECT